MKKQVIRKGLAMSESIRMDTDALRDYLLDHCDSAMFSGFPAAVLDVVDIEQADSYELRQMVERLGIDLYKFEVQE